MASIGEVWLVDFGHAFPDEPAELRPTLVVGPSALFGDDLPFVILAPRTTQRRGLSLHVEVEPTLANGLNTTSYVQCELMRSVSRRRLIARMGRVDDMVLSRVRAIVAVLLDL
jgi:mRNA interferase MazF